MDQRIQAALQAQDMQAMARAAVRTQAAMLVYAELVGVAAEAWGSAALGDDIVRQKGPALAVLATALADLLVAELQRPRSSTTNAREQAAE
jgi:hypothetical protein